MKKNLNTLVFIVMLLYSLAHYIVDTVISLLLGCDLISEKEYILFISVVLALKSVWHFLMWTYIITEDFQNWIHFEQLTVLSSTVFPIELTPKRPIWDIVNA
jgi:hypothetical protein